MRSIAFTVSGVLLALSVGAILIIFLPESSADRIWRLTTGAQEVSPQVFLAVCATGLTFAATALAALGRADKLSQRAAEVDAIRRHLNAVLEHPVHLWSITGGRVTDSITQKPVLLHQQEEDALRKTYECLEQTNSRRVQAELRRPGRALLATVVRNGRGGPFLASVVDMTEVRREFDRKLRTSRDEYRSAIKRIGEKHGLLERETARADSLVIQLRHTHNTLKDADTQLTQIRQLLRVGRISLVPHSQEVQLHDRESRDIFRTDHTTIALNDFLPLETDRRRLREESQKGKGRALHDAFRIGEIDDHDPRWCRIALRRNPSSPVLDGFVIDASAERRRAHFLGRV